jgi:hypothetical protein
MRLFGDVVPSSHIAPTGHEFADHLLVDHDVARTAIVLMIGQTHTASHSHSVKASHAHECLPRCVCEQDSVEEVVKPPRTKDGLEVGAEAVTVDG